VDLGGPRQHFARAEASARSEGGVPASQLLLTGQRAFKLREGAGGVYQTNGATPVAQTSTVDPRAAPLELNELLLDPARAQEVIQQLKSSDDPELIRYAEVIERAVANPIYTDWVSSAEPPCIVLTTSEGNGGEPVLVLVPPDYDPSVARPVHTHYHGIGSPVAAEPDSAETTRTIDSIWASTDPDPIFVLPETVSIEDDAATHGGWRLNGGINVNKTVEDALSAAAGDGEAPLISERVVSAHSRGGAALALSVLADPGSLTADRLLLLDSTMGANMAPEPSDRDVVDVDEVLANWLRAQQPDARPEVVVFTQSYTAPYIQAAMAGTGLYESRTSTSHEEANFNGMGHGYPENEPAEGTATPTP
jgi:hypothetical protein